MPVYEYRCEKCGKVHEVIQGVKDAPLSECSDCGGVLHKLISNTSFVLKGTGWYVTDYARKKDGEGEKKSAEKTQEQKPEKKSEAAAA